MYHSPPYHPQIKLLINHTTQRIKTKMSNKHKNSNNNDNDQIASWHIVENNPKHCINSNPNVSDPMFIPLRKPWGTIYSPNQILCFIPTLWPERKWKMNLIADTFAPGCSKLMWVVDDASKAPQSYAGYEFLSLPLTRH